MCLLKRPNVIASFTECDYLAPCHRASVKIAHPFQGPRSEQGLSKGSGACWTPFSLPPLRSAGEAARAYGGDFELDTLLHRD